MTCPQLILEDGVRPVGVLQGWWSELSLEVVGIGCENNVCANCDYKKINVMTSSKLEVKNILHAAQQDLRPLGQCDWRRKRQGRLPKSSWWYAKTFSRLSVWIERARCSLGFTERQSIRNYRSSAG